MKKTLFTIAAAVMMFAATSCKKENINEPEVLRDPAANEFLASIDGGGMVQNAPRVNDGMNTMATFNPNDKLQVLWQQKDVIYVNGIQFTCNSNPETNNRAYFENESYKTSGYQALEYHAFYSTSVSNTSGNGGTLNATQYYNPDRQAENLPMYAYSTDHWLNFSNICAAVKIYVPCTADSIVISNTSAAMNGNFTVDNESHMAVINDELSEDNKKITIYKVTKGSTTVFHPGDSLYVAIPDGEYEGFCITFFEGENIAYTTGASNNALKVAANKMYVIGDYKFEKYLPGKFSIANGKTVLFTKGNLLYDRNNGTAYLAESQTYFPASWDANAIAWFTWNTDINSSSQDTHDHSANGTIFALNFTLDTESLQLMSKNEWASLMYNEQGVTHRSNWADLYKLKVDVGGTLCIVIAPDDFVGQIKTKYNSLKEANRIGLVCLPYAGHSQYNESQASAVLSTATSGRMARYWTATNNDNDNAYNLVFNENGGTEGLLSNGKSVGRSIRLVKVIARNTPN